MELTSLTSDSLFPLKRFSNFILCIGVLFLNVYVYHMCAWYPGKSKEGVRYSGPGVVDGCEPHVGTEN